MTNRVTISVGSLDPAAEYAVVDRRLVGTSVYTVVRGGSEVDASSGSILVYDYEFPTGGAVEYRVRTYDASDVLLDTYSDTITPSLDVVWLKSPARPFLNRAVTVVDFSEVESPARGGVLEVLGRRLPVAVTEVRGSRRYSLVLRAATRAEADALELFFSFGDVAFIHVPDGCPVPRSMYAFVGDVSAERRGRAKGEVRYFVLPLTEVDAPDPAIVGYTVTWQGVQGGWATWTDLLADPDVPTWLDLQSYVSAPDDEVVG